jgi:hypothetical protein
MTGIIAVIDTSVVNQLETLGKRWKGLVVEFLAGVNVLGLVGLVEGHIEPFHLETCTGHDNLARK